MLAPIEPAPSRPPPLAAALLEAELGPVVMADDPCAAAFGSANRTGARNYYRARYYDPKIGRFISEDPVALFQTGTPYGYVGGQPTTTADPSGLYRIYSGSPWFRARIKEGFEKLREELEGECSCLDYFREQKNPLFREILPTLLEGSSVYPIVLADDTLRGAYADTKGSKTTFKVSTHWLERSGTFVPPCMRASVLLHELGHLARESAHDDDDSPEAEEFFEKCRVGCVDPRFR